MTVTINGTDGSVSAPAVTGSTGGTGTGVYYPASNQVAIATNGVQSVIVASGNTTFGTAIPANAAGTLNVAGTGPSANGWVGQFGNASGSIAVLAGVRSGIASVGAQSASTLVINPDGGQLQLPSQSAFIAGMSVTSTATIIPFNTSYLNRGSNYNTSTYTYTAPVTGLYFFNIIISYDGSGTNPNAGFISLYVNGGRQRDFFEANPAWSTNTEWHSSCIFYLTAGDTAYAANPSASNIQGGSGQSYYSLFSGYLIG